MLEIMVMALCIGIIKMKPEQKVKEMTKEEYYKEKGWDK